LAMLWLRLIPDLFTKGMNWSGAPIYVQPFLCLQETLGSGRPLRSFIPGIMNLIIIVPNHTIDFPPTCTLICLKEVEGGAWAVR